MEEKFNLFKCINEYDYVNITFIFMGFWGFGVLGLKREKKKQNDPYF